MPGRALLSARFTARASDAEVARLTERVRRRIGKLLERRGLGPQANRKEPDALLLNQPLLAELYSASISGLVATGPRAGRRRLRPILMTALATIFGMLPLALGIRSGAEVLQPLAIAVIGGASISMILSLLVTLVLFYLLKQRGL